VVDVGGIWGGAAAGQGGRKYGAKGTQKQEEENFATYKANLIFCYLSSQLFTSSQGKPKSESKEQEGKPKSESKEQEEQTKE
jgi:hypothetical protein